MKISKQMVPARFPCNYIYVLYIFGKPTPCPPPPPPPLLSPVWFCSLYHVLGGTVRCDQHQLTQHQRHRQVGVYHHRVIAQDPAKNIHEDVSEW